MGRQQIEAIVVVSAKQHAPLRCGAKKRGGARTGTVVTVVKSQCA